jgi:sugar/nucleoside kinase (ribokinase family)
VTRSQSAPAGEDDRRHEAFDVVGLGVNALDLTGIIDGFPEPDRKYPMHGFSVQGGGVTATAMVACARLGLRARYVGKVGSDFFSRLSTRSLSREGVDTRGVIREPDCDGHVSIVLADRQTGQRALFFRRPDAYAIRPEELDREIVTSGRLLHLDGIDSAAALIAIGWAREKGMRVTMDGERIVPGIEAVWPKVDLLVSNPRFLAQMTGTNDLRDGLSLFASKGPSRVAVTLGPDGVLGLCEGRFLEIRGFPVNAVDTNGAGDVFHGACTVGELRNWPLEWTLTFASAVAAMKCRALGGRAGIPRMDEVAAFLSERGHPEIAEAAGSAVPA